MPIPIENFFSFAKADSNKSFTDCRPFFKLHRVQFMSTSGCAWDSSRAKSSLNVYDQEANDACGAHDRIKDTQPPWSWVKWRRIAPSWQFRCQLHANIHLTWTCIGYGGITLHRARRCEIRLCSRRYAEWQPAVCYTAYWPASNRRPRNDDMMQ